MESQKRIWETHRAKERLEKCDEIENQLDKIDGIEYVGFTTKAKFTGYQECVLEITISGDTITNFLEKNEFIPDHNVRSISQQISHTLRQIEDISTYDFAESPTKVSEGTYDDRLYIVDLSLV